MDDGERAERMFCKIILHPVPIITSIHAMHTYQLSMSTTITCTMQVISGMTWESWIRVHHGGSVQSYHDDSQHHSHHCHEVSSDGVGWHHPVGLFTGTVE